MTDMANPTERWLPIDGFDGRYEVSDIGRVRDIAPVRFACRGSRVHNAKLTEKDIVEIFRLRAAGWLLKRIGERFGVTGSNICRILKKNRWHYSQQICLDDPA